MYNVLYTFTQHEICILIYMIIYSNLTDVLYVMVVIV